MALVGYEMIIANPTLIRASLAVNYLISNTRSWNTTNILQLGRL